MIFVFDTSAFIDLNNYYPGVFKSVWAGLDQTVAAGQISSTREVWNELDRTTISRPVHQWAKQNRQIFTTPTGDELKIRCDHPSRLAFSTVDWEQAAVNGNACR